MVQWVLSVNFGSGSTVFSYIWEYTKLKIFPLKIDFKLKSKEWLNYIDLNQIIKSTLKTFIYLLFEVGLKLNMCNRYAVQAATSLLIWLWTNFKE